MPRLRLGVALLVPEPAAREIDGLRRGCGDGALQAVAPHLTLVPPVNVREEELGPALRLLRDVACETDPLGLVLGPPTSFLPDNPTVYLPVTGTSDMMRRLHDLRDRVFQAPLERPLTWPFVPHVTIADAMALDRIDATVAALADFSCEVTFDRVHLLRESRHGPSDRRWSPVADHRFTRRAIVGRGGFELELTASELIDPEARAFELRSTEEGDDARSEAGPIDDRDEESWGRPVVVVARHDGEVVGLARARSDGVHREIESLVVAPEAQLVDVEGHLRAHLDAVR